MVNTSSLFRRAAAASPYPPAQAHRPGARGRFLFQGEEKLYIRGVTYGTFRPGPDCSDYPAPEAVAQDLAQMAANGVNAVRTYTVPPRWFLDEAQRRGLHVISSGSVSLGLELATAIDFFWVTHDPHEGMRWFAALLEHPAAEAAPPHLLADALRSYGGSTDLAGDYEAAEQLWQRSLAVFEQLGDEHGRAVLLHRLAMMALRRGDLDRARELTEASHELHQTTGNRWAHVQTLSTLGAIARDAGDEQLALELIGQSAAMAREIGIRWWESGALAELAMLSLNAGRLDEGKLQALESLSLAEQLRDRAGRVFGVGLLARIAAERGRAERAGRLWGAIEHEDAGAPLGGWRRHRQACETRIRDVAGPDFERGYAEGRLLTLDDAVSLALESDDA